MSEEKTVKTVWRVDVADEAATLALARDVATLLRKGDTLTLAGDLGAGKTTFARAIIRALMKDPAVEAPSPTFTLMQVYESDTARIVHADFYRIDSGAELTGLGWEEEADDAIVLIEWAERAPEVLPADRLDIRLSFTDGENPEARRLTISGHGAFASRLNAFKALREVLRRSGWSDATRHFLMGDASSRAYETLEKPDGARAILMISPPRPDGPPIRYGKPYSAIARLAENVKPFVAIADGLRAQGLSSPEIYGADYDAGLLVVEDLGREGVIDENGPIPERYLEAAAALAHLHAQKLPDTLPVEGAGSYQIPPYDMDALLIETDLLHDWYAPHVKTTVPSGARANFANLWRSALVDIAAAPPTWTLRDYHSPNLIWLPEREGVRKIGMIDFQDCVLGHPAYDMASLGQDARVTVPDDLELKLLAHYARLRRASDESFDMAGFASAYMVLAAQRATKVLGIFARLNQRDGKPHYLAHLPRIEAYLRKCLRHPALAELKSWYEGNLPGLFDKE
ncbi:tRNA (adenosine(37)-N6)-threonylcarbamoyltransferase complex ATPase subunit type 1 TsaE [Methylocystis echinoides]|uniref:tRNA threonylcarbamoyladenosine biosynthesis protein TsaE n=1 Tax=Methylocystis echinoides TaxID=29468 RepID=A0A9W6GT06_9HYPH|nr:tRNA (adenosine(37)-N6)-threonylcarbamoyltransferase complex ATPase subunit type 1 TsaE [Methylocystis echinoides]GLI92486.1 bifunctional tRNA (adenosine(37)-N6)-threonylcarbamoyltransferase complex ATPase subunit type 1 TsaE/phosphotransferase [Methylocystis echinoides]